MAAQFAYFSIFSLNSFNANNRISIGLYSEASKITIVTDLKLLLVGIKLIKCSNIKVFNCSVSN